MSLKIRIITIHCIPNFGSVFQAYALCRYLQDSGYEDVSVIDYLPGYFDKVTLRSRLGILLNQKAYKTRTAKFRNFVKTNIPLTEKTYYSLEELKSLNGKADIFVSGGDQLWNVYHDCGNDDAYKLTFTVDKKISYATSLGQTDFTDEQLSDLASKLKSFSAISVREGSSVPMLAKKGIAAVHCIDPVFLLDRSVYDGFLKPVEQPKYMLVYLVTPSELLEKCISKLSQKSGLKVILCSGFSKKCTCDLFLKDLGPEEILSYIKNAEIVLSSSFHATAFSLIFEKQFFTILPDTHTNERITNLLETRNLIDRIITNISSLDSVLDKRIDYDALIPYDKDTRRSTTYLQEALSDDK